MRDEAEAASSVWNGGRRPRVIACNHDGADAHRAETLESVGEAAFDDVLEVDGAQYLLIRRDDERRAAQAGDPVDIGLHGFRVYDFADDTDHFTRYRKFLGRPAERAIIRRQMFTQRVLAGPQLLSQGRADDCYRRRSRSIASAGRIGSVTSWTPRR